MAINRPAMVERRKVRLVKMEGMVGSKIGGKVRPVPVQKRVEA